MSATATRAAKRPVERRNLTDAYVKKLIRDGRRAKPDQRDTIYDELVTGLGISITSNGALTWILNIRYPGAKGMRPARAALGKLNSLTLAEARDKARLWKDKVSRGINPLEEKRQLFLAETERRARTFEALAEDYIKGHLKGKRQGKPVEREIRREFIPKWGSRPITDITPDDVRRLVKGIKDRGAVYVAHSALATARSIFSFALEQGGYGLAASPVERIKAKKLIGVKKARKRVLDDDELRAYWHGAKTLGSPWMEFYHLLVLTGQRKTEVAGMRRGEFNWPRDGANEWGNPLWTIPEERFKSGHVHLVPLSGQARDIIVVLPEFKGPCMLTTEAGRIPIRNFGRAKFLLDAAMAKELGQSVKPWVQHDVRRTVRTRLSELGVRFEVAELIIGHALKGLHAVYDQHKFLDERREALELWARRLREIVETKP